MWPSSAPTSAKALFGSASPLGETLTLAGDSYVVVGELAKRRGGFFGENRQDNVLTLRAGTVRNRLTANRSASCSTCARSRASATACLRQAEAILRLLRKLPPTPRTTSPSPRRIRSSRRLTV